MPAYLIKKAEEEIRRHTIRLFQRHRLLTTKEAQRMLRWWHSGFSLHAEVRVHAEDRDSLERLIRYCARPAFASENLKWVRKGKLLAYTLPKLKDRKFNEVRDLSPGEKTPNLIELRCLIQPILGHFMSFSGPG